MTKSEIDAHYFCMPDNHTNPSYYSRWKIQPLDFILANNLDFLRGNIIKYIMRYDVKGGIEDLKKARFYLDRLIQKCEENGKD